ncbi:MAG: efflux RND transporter periplasmic adaptor subunit [Gammaproteobacteria bacterium]|nr:efflux RND transporter periplasmic adaptor subunit [Gammaproteobacteria bacterium]
MKLNRYTNIRILCCLLLLPTCVFAQWDAALVVTDVARLERLAPSVEVPGTVVSRHDSRLAAELNAKLVWIAEVGTEVKEGDTVARLENVTFDVGEKEAQARVDREQARVVFLESELQRLRQLSEQNLSAASRLDETVADLAAAAGDHQIARAQLAYAQIAMYTTQIRAPFDGVVTERLRSIGERLNVADEVIRLVDPGALEVVARAPLRSANFINKGDIISIGNDFRSGQAPIRAMVPFGDPQSHMFEVRLDADAELWTVGESVRLTMPTAEAKEVLAVPRDALVLRREGVTVFKVLADSSVAQVNVTVGLGAGPLIEVFGQLAAGDVVVVRGAEGLSDGMTVEVASQ